MVRCTQSCSIEQHVKTPNTTANQLRFQNPLLATHLDLSLTPCALLSGLYTALTAASVQLDALATVPAHYDNRRWLELLRRSCYLGAGFDLKCCNAALACHIQMELGAANYRRMLPCFSCCTVVLYFAGCCEECAISLN